MVENELVNILESLELSQEFDVILQGTLDTEDEPDNYFTYWCWDNPRDGFFDNKHSRNNLGYQITAYSTDRTFLLEMINNAITGLENKGFIIENDETDVASGNKTHTAKIIDVYFIKKKED